MTERKEWKKPVVKKIVAGAAEATTSKRTTDGNTKGLGNNYS